MFLLLLLCNAKEDGFLFAPSTFLADETKIFSASLAKHTV